MAHEEKRARTEYGSNFFLSEPESFVLFQIEVLLIIIFSSTAHLQEMTDAMQNLEVPLSEIENLSMFQKIMNKNSGLFLFLFLLSRIFSCNRCH
jgi:hypothetical protein